MMVAGNRAGSSMANEGPQDNNFELTLTTLLVGCLLTALLLAATSEILHEVMRTLAWLHVMPFAELDRAIPESETVPLLGQWLLVPARVAETALQSWTRGDDGPVPWSACMAVAARCAVVIYCLPCCVLMHASRGSRPDLKFRTRYTLDTLIAALAPAWPAGGIARHLAGPAGQSRLGGIARPLDESLGNLLVPLQEADALPAESDALWPEHWLVNRGLVKPAPGDPVDQDVPRPPPDSDWKFLTRDTVGEVLALQLSEPWPGIDSLKSHEQALVAAFACCHAHQLADGRQILIELARLADRHFAELWRFDGRLACHSAFMARIRAVLQSPVGQAVAEVARHHAWKPTALMAILHHARDDRGIVAPSEFLWLKHADRQLWYALNCVGNAVAVAEAAGIHAHYRAECQMGCALHRPAVAQASRILLEDYLDQSATSVARRRRWFLIRQSPTDRIAAGKASSQPLFPGLARWQGMPPCGR